MDVFESWEYSMTKTLIACAALAAISFGANAQPSYGAYRDSQIQAQQQYQAPQPGSEHYNPELDPRSPQYNANNVPRGHAYANDPQNAQVAPQYQQAPQRRYDNRAYNNRAQDNRYYDNNRERHAYAHTPRYARGGYAPEWRSERYWVRDWRERRLQAPPRGYTWVQTDTGDLLLMAIATGLIANVVIASQ
jgi:Ni/Co efflux regulator RcnB